MRAENLVVEYIHRKKGKRTRLTIRTDVVVAIVAIIAIVVIIVATGDSSAFIRLAFR